MGENNPKQGKQNKTRPSATNWMNILKLLPEKKNLTETEKKNL